MGNPFPCRHKRKTMEGGGAMTRACTSACRCKQGRLEGRLGILFIQVTETHVETIKPYDACDDMGNTCPCRCKRGIGPLEKVDEAHYHSKYK